MQSRRREKIGNHAICSKQIELNHTRAARDPHPAVKTRCVAHESASGARRQELMAAAAQIKAKTGRHSWRAPLTADIAHVTPAGFSVRMGFSRQARRRALQQRGQRAAQSPDGLGCAAPRVRSEVRAILFSLPLVALFFSLEPCRRRSQHGHGGPVVNCPARQASRRRVAHGVASVRQGVLFRWRHSGNPPPNLFVAAPSPMFD